MELWFKLVGLHLISEERTKYVWEDFDCRPLNEIIGRIYLLKAHEELNQPWSTMLDKDRYTNALALFERALASLAEPGVNEEYYYRALADKAVLQCLCGQARSAVALFEKACAYLTSFYHTELKLNLAAALVLDGAFVQALALLDQELDETCDRKSLILIRANCLLHMERYDEAIVAYERLHDKHELLDSRGLEAARQHRQPDWDCLQ
jgi:tetratricopeptide (TPR) repeat protein